MKLIKILSAASVFMIVTVSATAQTLDDGIKLLDEKQFSAAKPIIEKHYKANSKDPRTSISMARIYAQNDFLDLDQAVELAEFAVEKEPKNVKYLVILGSIYGKKASGGMFAGMKYGPKVKDVFEKVVALDPNHIDARVGLYNFYKRAPSAMGGDINTAKMHLAAVEKIDKKRGYPLWADFYKSEPNDAKYEEFALKAIEADPKNTSVINQLGYFYIEKKKHDKAISVLKKYAEAAPNDPNAYDSMGDALKANNQTDEALKSYLKAISVDPKFSASVLNAAKIYNGKNQKKEAVSILKNYIKIATNEDDREKAEDLLDDLE